MIIPEILQRLGSEHGNGRVVSIKFDRETCIIELSKTREEVEVDFRNLKEPEPEPTPLRWTTLGTRNSTRLWPIQ